MSYFVRVSPIMFTTTKTKADVDGAIKEWQAECAGRGTESVIVEIEDGRVTLRSDDQDSKVLSALLTKLQPLLAKGTSARFHVLGENERGGGDIFQVSAKEIVSVPVDDLLKAHAKQGAASRKSAGAKKATTKAKPSKTAAKKPKKK
jgi:hypothetical protein